MLVKLSLQNVKILNVEDLYEKIKVLYESRKSTGARFDRLDLILKPTWYAESAAVCSLFSVDGWSLEEYEKNPAIQRVSVFLKQRGIFSPDKEPEDEDIPEDISEIDET